MQKIYVQSVVKAQKASEMGEQFVELGQASELTLGHGFYHSEGLRFLFYLPDMDY